MKNKKEYISPEVKIVLLETDKILAALSGAPAPGGQEDARRNRQLTNWDYYEEESFSWPKSKSVWDD